MLFWCDRSVTALSSRWVAALRQRIVKGVTVAEVIFLNNFTMAGVPGKPSHCRISRCLAWL